MCNGCVKAKFSRKLNDLFLLSKKKTGDYSNNDQRLEEEHFKKSKECCLIVELKLLELSWKMF